MNTRRQFLTRAALASAALAAMPSSRATGNTVFAAAGADTE